MSDTQSLLSPVNVDRQRLMDVTKQVVDFATKQQIPNLQYAMTHRGQDDVAIFDFTNFHQAKFSCYARERREHKLFLTIVGDSVIEVSIAGNSSDLFLLLETMACLKLCISV